MTDEELRILAWTILGEAGGEGAAGMEAVAHVIRNRSLSGRFPDNPASVALQSNSSGIHQFSAWNAISQGGNIPRSRYPVGSDAFTRALAVADKVFGATPGKDPTQGATHYYSPKGMKDGAAPYWWRSEAAKGEKRIGNHIFAIKRDDAVAPTPVKRSASDKGNFPSSGQLEVFRTGAPLKLPVIGPTGGPSLKDAPKPARKSAAMQERTLSGGSTEGAITTSYVLDPITGKLLPKSVPISDLVRKAGQAKVTQPAKAVQSIAGFSSGSAEDFVDYERKQILKAQTPTYAVSDAAKPAAKKPSISDMVRGKQTQFAQPLAQPNGSVINGKPEEKLLPNAGLPEPTGPVVKKVAPVPRDPIQRPPVVPVARPPVAPPTVAATIRAEPKRAAVETLESRTSVDKGGQTTIRPPSEGYGSKGYTTIISAGGQKYDNRSGTWI